MPMTQTDLQNVQEVKAKAEELKKLVMNSLSIRAVGGVHIANELIKVLPKLEALEAAIQADINAQPVV